MSKYLKILILILVVLVLVAGGVKLLKKRKQELAKLPKPEKPVYVLKGAIVKKGSIKQTRQFLGRVVSDRTVNLSTRYSGYIEKVFVSENDKVKKGQTVFIVDKKPVEKEISNLKLSIDVLESQLSALLSQKEASKVSYETAKKIYLRDKKLYQKKGISKERLEISYSNYKKAEAQYQNILAKIKEVNSKIKQIKNKIKIKQIQLSYLDVKSPVDGIVSKVFLKEGNLALPGKPVVQIQTTENYKILVDFPPEVHIKENSEAKIKAQGKQIKAHIRKIYPSADKNSLYTAEIVVDKLPPDIKSGSLVNVEVVLKEAKGFVVPKNALLHLSNGDYVLVGNGNQIRKLPVEVLAENEKQAVVKGALKEGVIVAVGDESKLRLVSFMEKGKVVE